MDPGRMLHKAVKQRYHDRQDGDILMDAPATKDWKELVQEVWDIKEWRTHVRKIKDTIEIKAKGGGKRLKYARSPPVTPHERYLRVL